MRTQRRAGQTVQIERLATVDGAPGVELVLVHGAVFEPKSTRAPRAEEIAQTLAAGAWHLPGAHRLSGDDRIIDAVGNRWQVTEASTVWLDRTEVAVRRPTALPTLVTIGPGGGAPTWSEAAGSTVVMPAEPVYVGRAQLIARTITTAAPMEAAGDDLSPLYYDVELDPALDTTAIETGYVLTVTPGVGAPGDDPGLWGKTLTVVGVLRGSARRAPLLTARIDT